MTATNTAPKLITLFRAQNAKLQSLKKSIEAYESLVKSLQEQAKEILYEQIDATDVIADALESKGITDFTFADRRYLTYEETRLCGEFDDYVSWIVNISGELSVAYVYNDGILTLEKLPHR